MPSISSILSNSQVNQDGTIANGIRAHKATLGQDDFLQLLVKQMTAQDPMNPQGDTEFIAQMAQFSALEQSKSMSSDIATLKGQQEVLTANGLIGRTVVLNDGEKVIGQGMVQGVSINDEGAPEVIINGQSFGLEYVDTITPFAATV